MPGSQGRGQGYASVTQCLDYSQGLADDGGCLTRQRPTQEADCRWVAVTSCCQFSQLLNLMGENFASSAQGAVIRA